MKTIRQPQWHAARCGYHYQSRRILDFAGHDLVLNSRLPKRFIDRVLEAFEVKDRKGEFVGIVFKTPTTRFAPDGGGHERIRNRFDWHAINSRHKRVKDWREHWGGKRVAVAALMFAEQQYWQNLRRRRTSISASDLEAIAAAFS